MTTNSSGNGRLFALMGGIAALVAIFVFVTGIVDRPSIFSSEARLQRKLAGSWRAENSGEVLNFYEDGSYASNGTLLPSSGFYRVADENHITVEYSGLFALVGTQTLRVSVSGDTLYIQDSMGYDWGPYSKID